MIKILTVVLHLLLIFSNIIIFVIFRELTNKSSRFLNVVTIFVANFIPLNYRENKLLKYKILKCIKFQKTVFASWVKKQETNIKWFLMINNNKSSSGTSPSD